MKYVKYQFIALLAILAIITGITGCGNEDDPVITRVTLTYNTNGSTSGTTPTAMTQETGTTITLDAGSGFSRTGYTFSGWNTSADGTGTNYAGGSSYTLNSNITLYANWMAISTTQYTLTYNANGATSGEAPTAVTAEAGTNITLNAGTGLSRTGHTFGGWNTNADGTGTNYAGGSSYTLNSNVTLHAKWNTESTGTSNNLKLTIGDKTATAVLYDNATARDFKSRLPFTVTMTDYAGTEKIFYPDPKLSTEGAPAGFDPSIGDITVYAPWGNVALFYKDFGYSSGLISVGKITGGMEAFTVSGSITVKFELAE